jgi:hypothetical protein
MSVVDSAATRLPRTVVAALSRRLAAHNKAASPSARTTLPALAAVYMRGYTAAPPSTSTNMRARSALVRAHKHLDALTSGSIPADADLAPKKPEQLGASSAAAVAKAQEYGSFDIAELVASY